MSIELLIELLRAEEGASADLCRNASNMLVKALEVVENLAEVLLGLAETETFAHAHDCAWDGQGPAEDVCDCYIGDALYSVGWLILGPTDSEDNFSVPPDTTFH